MICLEIFELDPAKFISAPRVTWSRKTGVELDLLTDIDMLLMVEKGIGGGVWNLVHQYPKANNKFMKGYDKNKESSYINYWDINNFYVCSMSQKLSTFNFEWVEDILQFTELFIKNYDEKREVGYVL